MTIFQLWPKIIPRKKKHPPKKNVKTPKSGRRKAKLPKKDFSPVTSTPTSTIPDYFNKKRKYAGIAEITPYNPEIPESMLKKSKKAQEGHGFSWTTFR